MRTRLAQVIGCGLTAAALLAASAPPAAAATTRTFLVQSNVFVRTNASPGATVSIIQTCPRGSRFDAGSVGFTVGLSFDNFLNVPFEPPGYRFRGTEYWPAGTVTRWQVRSRAAARSDVWSYMACLITVSATAKTYTGRIKTTVRVWGPTAPATALQFVMSPSATSTEAFADQGFPSMVAKARRIALRTRNATATFQPPRTGISTVRGRTLGRLVPGRFAEITNWTDLTTNFRVLPFF